MVSVWPKPQCQLVQLDIDISASDWIMSPELLRRYRISQNTLNYECLWSRGHGMWGLKGTYTCRYPLYWWVSELVYLLSLLNSQGLMSNWPIILDMYWDYASIVVILPLISVDHHQIANLWIKGFVMTNSSMKVHVRVSLHFQHNSENPVPRTNITLLSFNIYQKAWQNYLEVIKI